MPALGDLVAATPNKGGHGERGLALIDQASNDSGVCRPINGLMGQP